jgi:hypothetical protein
LPETTPGAGFGEDSKRGGAFVVVERAKARVSFPRSAQFDRIGDEVYDVNAGFDFVNIVHVLDARWKQWEVFSVGLPHGVYYNAVMP